MEGSKHHFPLSNISQMHSRVVRQDRHLCFDWNTLITWSGKNCVTFEPIMQIYNHSVLPLLHSLTTLYITIWAWRRRPVRLRK